MSTLVTKEAPDFTAQAVLPNNEIGELTLSKLRGKYVVLFFYPLDFTFVCPSEIIAFDKALDKFKERNAEVLGVSVDSQFSHFAWKNTPRDHGGIGNVQYPLVADITKEIARSYGVLVNDYLDKTNKNPSESDVVAMYEALDEARGGYRRRRLPRRRPGGPAARTDRGDGPSVPLRQRGRGRRGSRRAMGERSGENAWSGKPDHPQRGHRRDGAAG